MSEENTHISWPSIAAQEAYWREMELEKTEASCDWYDHWSLLDEGRSDGCGESYAERNV